MVGCLTRQRRAFYMVSVPDPNPDLDTNHELDPDPDHNHDPDPDSDHNHELDPDPDHNHDPDPDTNPDPDPNPDLDTLKPLCVLISNINLSTCQMIQYYLASHTNRTAMTVHLSTASP